MHASLEEAFMDVTRDAVEFHGTGAKRHEPEGVAV